MAIEGGDGCAEGPSVRGTGCTVCVSVAMLAMKCSLQYSFGYDNIIDDKVLIELMQMILNKIIEDVKDMNK